MIGLLGRYRNQCTAEILDVLQSALHSTQSDVAVRTPAAAVEREDDWAACYPIGQGRHVATCTDQGEQRGPLPASERGANDRRCLANLANEQCLCSFLANSANEV